MNVAHNSRSRVRRTAFSFLFPAIAAGVALFALGCTVVVDPPVTTGKLAVTLEPLGPRSMTVDLPDGLPIGISAPSTLEAAEKRTGVSEATSKAWVRADKVLYEIFNGSTLMFSAWDYPAVSINTSSTLGTTTITGIPEGNYDWLRVSIYNNANGSNPVSIGWVSGIHIYAGSTSSASLNCIPVIITDLSAMENTWNAQASLPLRGEKWYKVPAILGSTTFSINRVLGNLDLYVFDVNGIFAGNETSSIAGIRSIVLATPETYYYVALFGYAAGIAQVKYKNGGVL